MSDIKAETAALLKIVLGDIEAFLDSHKSAYQNLTQLLSRLNSVCDGLTNAAPVSMDPIVAEGRRAAYDRIDPERVRQKYRERGVQLFGFDDDTVEKMVRESIKAGSKEQRIIERGATEDAVVARWPGRKVPHPHGFQQNFSEGMGMCPPGAAQHPSVVAGQDHGTRPEAKW